MSGLKAVAVITGDDNSVKGSLHFLQQPDGVTQVKGKITGLKPGPHGFHVHALGDTTNGCNSTGPHFNPLNKEHGAPWDNVRHAGDLGNIVAGQDGMICLKYRVAEIIPLSGQYSILGRAVVIHADSDDLGRGNHELSKSTGNAGARVGCGNFHLSISIE
ncbi:superoxide dismutase [Cu-Zn] 2 [Tanacetum coccineum]